MRNGRLKALLAREEGESLISFALTMPILIAVIFGMMETCLAYYNYERISELAREGTRYAIFHGSTCLLSTGSSCTSTAASIETAITSAGMPALGGASTAATVTFPDGDQVPGHRVKVVVTCTYPYNIPFLFNHGITMTSTSMMYIVQ
jgi:Flp pilus assembly protein TadG